MHTPPSSPRWPQIAALLGCLQPVSGAWAQHSDPATTVYPGVQILEMAQDDRQFDKTEVTGSSILRKEQTTALPVQVITRDDIRRAGSNSMAEVLQNLPIMSMVVTSAAMSATIGGYSTASLRSLPAGTLLLLNGKRLAAYGRQSVAGADRPSVDINTVPLSAVDRIEVLSDGASSLYGSDAIAGVINIITRTQQKGVEIMVEKVATSQGGGAGQQVTLNAGVGQLKNEGYSLRLTLEAAQRDALQAQDRPQYAQGRYQVARDGQNYAIDGSKLTLYATPGVFYIPAASGQASQAYSVLYQNGQCPSTHVPQIGRPSCQYNGYADMTIYPRQDSQKLLLAGEKFLGRGATGYLEFLYTTLQDSDFSANAWPQLSFKLGTTPTSVGVQEAVSAGLDPRKVQFLWAPSGLPNLSRTYQQRNARLAMGLKGEWGAWDYHAALYQAQARVQRRLEVADFASVGWVSGATLIDPNMLRPLTADNPLTSQINALRQVYKDWDEGSTQTTSANWRASRPLMEIEGHDVMLGAGLEWRRESTDYRIFSFTASQPNFRADRDVQAASLELLAPLAPQWDVTLSTRADRYSDFGGTHNNKLSSRFDFQNGWSARTSWGTGFRAPALAQMQELDQLYLIGQTTYLATCTADMLAAAARLTQSTQRATRCVSNTAIGLYGNGNPDLKPELSTQKSIGLAFRPDRNASITVDWWSIQMRDVIATFPDAWVVADPLRYPQYWVRQGNGVMGMKLPNFNIGRRQKSGIDFDVRWRAPTDMGQWNLSVQGTYNLKSEDQTDPSQPAVSDLARYSSLTDSITPRLRMRWMAGLTTPGWSLHGVLNHTSAYADQDSIGVNVATGQSVQLTGFKVPAFTTLDVNASVQLHPALSLRASIGNILNQQAPQSFAATAIQVFGFNTRDHNLWGRTLRVALEGKF
ncbi:MAG: TonB-dependent receptor [Pseudomonadota bacterium]